MEELGVILLLLFVTFIVYMAFPLIYAGAISKPITEKKYKRICFGVNFMVSCIFMFIRGGAVNLAPYLLWTGVFTSIGMDILKKKELLIKKEIIDKKLKKAYICKNCGYGDTQYFKNCPICGSEDVHGFEDCENNL